jgi:hypothetical protein
VVRKLSFYLKSLVPFWFLLLSCLTSGASYAQIPTNLSTTDTVATTKILSPWWLAGGAAVYTGSLIALGETWYQDQPRSAFHWFNDAQEWKQVDKAGHFWSALHESRLGIEALRRTGVPEKKAIWYGGLLGIVLQSPIEYLDGRSPDYGASASDLAANAAGSFAVIGQQLAWGETRILPKFSFHSTRYAAIRPNVLGKTWQEQTLKDYNGQTYWLSVDVAKFLPSTSRYPKWLNVALGYGAEEVVYHDADANRLANLSPYRQYYLSVDLNWQAIPTRSKFLKGTFALLSVLKFPAPALEYSKRHGLKAHPIYF